MELHPHLTRYLVVRMYLSMSPMCSFAVHVCRWAGAKKCEGVQIHCHHGNRQWWNLYLYIWYSLALIPMWFQVLLCCCMIGLTWNLSPFIFCVGKGSHWQSKIHGCLHIWWCLDMIGGKGILGVVMWCSGILLIALPCMVGIWGTYMASALLVSSVVIGNLLIRFFWEDYFKVFVDSHPTSFCSILGYSSPLIYCLWKHELFLSMVWSKV